MFRLTKPLQTCSRSFTTHTKLPISFRQLTVTKRTFTTALKRPEISSTSKVLVLTTLGASSGSLLFKRPVQCQAVLPVQDTLNDVVQPKQEPVLNKSELTFGAFLGLCTGFFAKKISKLIVLCIGLGFVFLQYLSSKGYVNVDWSRMEKGYKRQLDTDHDGKVSMHDLSVKRDSFMDMLTNHVQFKSSFLVGFALGVRYA